MALPYEQSSRCARISEPSNPLQRIFREGSSNRSFSGRMKRYPVYPHFLRICTKPLL